MGISKRPNRFQEDVYQQHPDNDQAKTVSFVAVGWNDSIWGAEFNKHERHVYLQWLNLEDEKEDRWVTQIIQLSGQPSNYAYYAPYATLVTKRETLDANTVIPLGEFTRAQRDRILELANKVMYNRRSVVNNCQVWIRALLDSMVVEGLLESGKVDEIEREVPLLKPQPEL